MRKSALSDPAVPAEIDEAGEQPANVVRCGLCGDVIGVYEPLVLCQRSEPVLTSLAADPPLNEADTYYHHACYLADDPNISDDPSM